MAQQVYQLDWFATNETVKYPIDSQSSFVPVGHESIPAGLTGVITDISFAIPSTLAGLPYLAALTITDDLLSLIIFKEGACFCHVYQVIDVSIVVIDRIKY